MDYIRNYWVDTIKPDNKNKLHAIDYMDSNYQFISLANMGFIPCKNVTGEAYGLA